jgi:hypothetical protein
MPKRPLSLIFISALALAACDPVDPPSNADAAPGQDGGGDGDGGTGPSFKSTVYDTVFVPSGCTGGYCHGGGTGQLLMISAEGARDQLVGVDAAGSECLGEGKRVIPGDPENSLLYKKVKMGVAVCGDKMPAGSGGTGLSDVNAQRVYDWIAGGAHP